MKNMTKRLLAVTAASVMVMGLSMASVSAEEVDTEEAQKKAITATVTANAQGAGAYLLAPTELEVNAYEAESYGYTDTVADNVSTLDVLVAETEKIFGDSFTKETASAYLAVSDSGWITTIFGEETGNCGFYVNDAAPWTLVNGTAVASGDNVTFFLYQDVTTWSDKYVTFEEGKEISAEKGADVTVTAQSADWSGNITAVEGASIGYLTVKDGAADITEIGKTDSTGKVTFAAPAAGSYTIVVYGKDILESPVIMNTTKLTVTGTEEEPQVIEENTRVAVKKGTTFTVKGYTYKVTGNLVKNPTVTVVGYKNKKLKSITVASTVTYKKVVFKVTAISASAFKNQKYAVSAVIGKNVKTIGSKAFYGDKKLKKITVKTSVLTKAGSKTFYGIYKKAVIKVPSKKLTAYKKLLKNKGQKSTVKISK